MDILKNMYIIYLFALRVYMCVHVYAIAHMMDQRSSSQCQFSYSIRRVPEIAEINSGVMLGGKHLYWLNHFIRPCFLTK